MSTRKGSNKRIYVADKKESLKKKSLLAKLKLDQLFSGGRASSFHTAEDFFEGHTNSFLPMTTLYNPESQRGQSFAHPRLRIHKLSDDFDHNIGKHSRQQASKQPTIKEVYLCFLKQNHETISKTHAVTSSSRDRLINASKLTMEVPQQNQKRQIKFKTIENHSVDRNLKRQRIKTNWKYQLNRNNTSNIGKGEPFTSEDITGWNWEKAQENQHGF